MARHAAGTRRSLRLHRAPRQALLSLGTLVVAATAACLTAARRLPVLDFAGIRGRHTVRQPSLCSRSAKATGRTRDAPDANLEVGSLWRVDPQDFKQGWDSEQGMWVDIPQNMIKKWWQQPSYLTPYGYRQPPHWTKKDYALASTEMKFSAIEANMISELKKRGMTIEEIRARASVFEFIENDNLPKMTPKLQFLFQVKALYEGREDELIDMGDVFKEDTGKSLDPDDEKKK